MSYEIIVSPAFEKGVKKLRKKYRSLPDDLGNLLADLEANPYLGNRINENCYKVRLAIKSKGKGKSGGGRIITYVDIRIEDRKTDDNLTIYLLTIYDKSDIENLPLPVIDGLIKDNVNISEEE